MSSFKYEQLHSGGNSFRLLELLPGSVESTIQCNIRVAYLHQDEQYEAISYAWGRGQGAIGIELNGRQFNVSWMVADILMRMRHQQRHRMLWIDLLCIDQSNKSEKSEQIPLMKHIFGEAQMVLASLGPHGMLDSATSVLNPLNPESVKRVLGLASKLKANISSALRTQVSERDETALLEVLNHPWFDRVWVVQEAGMAQKLRLICGTTEIDGQVFAKVHSRVTRRGMSNSLKSRIDTLGPLLSYMSKDIDSKDKSKAFQKPELLDRLQTFRPWKATDPRDKLYAILDLSADGPGVEDLAPDYNLPAAVVYKRLTQYLMSRYRTPNLLMHALQGPPKQMPQQPESQPAWMHQLLTAHDDSDSLKTHHPTWCPDWSAASLCPTLPIIKSDTLHRKVAKLQNVSTAPFDSGSNLDSGMLRVCGFVLCTITSSQSADSHEVTASDDIVNRSKHFPSKEITHHLETISPSVRQSAARGLAKGDQLCMLYRFTGLAILRPHGDGFTLVWLEHGDFEEVAMSNSGALRKAQPKNEFIFDEISYGINTTFGSILDRLTILGRSRLGQDGNREFYYLAPLTFRSFTIV